MCVSEDCNLMNVVSLPLEISLSVTGDTLIPGPVCGLNLPSFTHHDKVRDVRNGAVFVGKSVLKTLHRDELKADPSKELWVLCPLAEIEYGRMKYTEEPSLLKTPRGVRLLSMYINVGENEHALDVVKIDKTRSRSILSSIHDWQKAPIGKFSNVTKSTFYWVKPGDALLVDGSMSVGWFGKRTTGSNSLFMRLLFLVAENESDLSHLAKLNKKVAKQGTRSAVAKHKDNIVDFGGLKNMPTLILREFVAWGDILQKRFTFRCMNKTELKKRSINLTDASIPLLKPKRSASVSSMVRPYEGDDMVYLDILPLHKIVKPESDPEPEQSGDEEESGKKHKKKRKKKKKKKKHKKKRHHVDEDADPQPERRKKKKKRIVEEEDEGEETPPTETADSNFPTDEEMHELLADIEF